ncbi:MAG: hypothetical protein ACRBDL_01295 [Alphaproteobacteria bacterium]
MELLVILLGEFLFFPVIAAIGAFVNLVAGLLSLMLELLLCAIPSSGREKVKASGAVSTHKKTVFPFKVISRVAGGLFLTVLILLFSVNTFLFEPTVRFIVSKVEENTKMEVSFSSASGDILSGAVKFTSLHIQRENDEAFDFDILAQSTSFDVDVYSLLSNSIVIENLIVEGVKGEAWDKAKQKEVGSQKPNNKFEAGIGDFKFGIELKDGNKIEDDVPPRKLEAKKKFIISDLHINGVRLDIYKNDKEPLVLALDKIHSAPFRSQYAVFDTFFRSNIEGSLNNHKITISTKDVGDGRNTKWHLDNFPVTLIKSYVHKAPFSWFERGSIDVLVEDKWQYGDNAEIEMDWRMQLKDVVVKAPVDASVISKALASPVVSYINKRSGSADFRFSLVMNEKQFESTSSLDASGLWDAAINALSKKMSAVTGKKKEAVKTGVENGIQGFKSFLNKKRNK